MKSVRFHEVSFPPAAKSTPSDQASQRIGNEIINTARSHRDKIFLDNFSKCSQRQTEKECKNNRMLFKEREKILQCKSPGLKEEKNGEQKNMD